MRIRFFRTQPPKGFDYKPVYYDEEKEKQAERLRMLEGVDKSEEERKLALRDSWDKMKGRRTPLKTAPFSRLLVIFLGLLILVYLLLR